MPAGDGILKCFKSAHFSVKWLLLGVLRVKKSCFFMQAWNARAF